MLKVKPITHSLPPGSPVTVARLSTATLPSSCTDPETPCLLRLPDPEVLATIVVDSGVVSSSGEPGDPGTLAAPDAACSALDGAHSFTSARHLGSAPYTITVEVQACLGRTAPDSTAAQLRALLASVTDSDAVTIDASWRRVTTGRFAMTIPPGWSFDRQQPLAPSNIVQVDGWCVVPTDAVAAGPCPLPTGLHVGPHGAYLWIRDVTSPSRANAVSEDGNSKQAYADCAAAGGRYPSSYQRHLGPQAGGEVVILSACSGTDATPALGTQISLVVASIEDSTYPNPARVCAAVPGTVEASALETVGDVRALTFGAGRPAVGVFPAAATSDFAAWCSVRDDAAERFHVWAAHLGSSPVKVVDVGFPIFEWTRPAPSTAPASVFASSGVAIVPSPTASHA